jgi:phospholipase D1/2
LIDAIDGAKTRIYICAWAIAPQLYLRRKDPLDIEDRLDHVLQRAAQRNVQVLVLFYDAPRVLHLESDWVHRVLNGLHKNIIAIRHPNSWSDMIWSHHQKSIIIDETIAFLGGIDLTYWRFDNRKYQILDIDEKTWPGKDYGNLFLHAEVNGPWMPGVIKRDEEPRMPWHDISLQVVGWVALDAAMNFIQRWNYTLRTGVAPRDCPPLMPLRVTQPLGRWPSSKTDQEFLGSGSDDGFEKINLARRDLGFDHLEGQIVRSASHWSSGVSVPERSIYKAYIDLITTAEHFIFIENQFFISSIDRGSPKNRITEALFLRLCQAITAKEKFKVMIVLPMWPGGAITDGSVRFMTNYTYRTINRGGHSILEQLQQRFPEVDLDEYIYFFSLRQRGVSDDIVHTEAIYIHAKLMLVDDRHAIVGSANINDRSLVRSDEESCVWLQ